MHGVSQNIFVGDLEHFVTTSEYSADEKRSALQAEITRLRTKASDPRDQLGSGEAARLIELISASLNLVE